MQLKKKKNKTFFKLTYVLFLLKILSATSLNKIRKTTTTAETIDKNLKCKIEIQNIQKNIKKKLEKNAHDVDPKSTLNDLRIR